MLQRSAVTGLALVLGCQAGITTTPPVLPLPATARGTPFYLTPEPVVTKVDNDVGLPFAVGLLHDIRDTLEEAGFTLAPSKDAAGGLVGTLYVDRVDSIHADLFIHGAQACGVKFDIARADQIVSSTQPDTACVATSNFYGVIRKDAAVGMVNAAVQKAAVIAAAVSSPKPEKPAQ